VSDDAILAFVRSTSNCSSGDVADEFGYTRRNALERLKQLADDGKLDADKVGNTNVWTAADE
jgi:predicted ArsR family transcriptional regulator